MSIVNAPGKVDFAGRDGFVWWVGEVEKVDAANHRCKVRIIGWYTGNEAKQKPDASKGEAGDKNQQRYLDEVKTDDLIKYLKDKNFTEVRKWVVANLDNDPSSLLRGIYDASYNCLQPQSIPAAVLTIAKYQYQIAFVADQEINLLAALIELMVECNFK